MSITHLRNALTQLHEEIEKTTFLDPKDEALLRELMGDIGDLLEASAAKRGGRESLGERLKDAIERFEDLHPTLTANIQRVADTLGRAAV